MCSVSVVYDYFRQHTNPEQWDHYSFDLLKQVIDKLNILDDKLDQHDCEDPAKAAWMREVEERLAKLEKTE